MDRLCTMATARAALERHAAQILVKRPDLRLLLGSIDKSVHGLVLQNKILNRIILKQVDEEDAAFDKEQSASQPKEGEQAGTPGDAAPGVQQPASSEPKEGELAGSRDEAAAGVQQPASSEPKEGEQAGTPGDAAPGVQQPASSEPKEGEQAGSRDEAAPGVQHSRFPLWRRLHAYLSGRFPQLGRIVSSDSSLPSDLEQEVMARRAHAKANRGSNVPIDYFSWAYKGDRLEDQSSRDVLRTLSSGMSGLENDIQEKLQFKEQSRDKLADPWDADNYMEYRVDRATYHFDKFSRLSLQIRVARVEGFQTYPELVKRRMEDAFVFVRNAKDYLREIAEQRTRMSSQIGNITQIVEAHESDEEQRKIAEIQDFAEFALLTFLLPYYIGYHLKETIPEIWEGVDKRGVVLWLIIIFTAINMVKRWLEGKINVIEYLIIRKKEGGTWGLGLLFTGKYWSSGEKTVPRKIGAVFHRIGSIITSINFLSIAAIVAAAVMLSSLPEGKGYGTKEGKASTALGAGRAAEAAAAQKGGYGSDADAKSYSGK